MNVTVRYKVRFRVRAADQPQRQGSALLEEPFRTLRSNILLHIQDPGKDHLPARAHPAEGKSTIPAGPALRTDPGSEGALLQDNRKCLLVTSARPGEGKSTICANLALRLASSGRRVLLLDADLRRPSLHQVFGVPNRTGLSQLLVGEMEPHDACQEIASGLTLLPSGPPPPDPQQLLMSEELDRVLRLMRDSFDMIVIDSPPVLSCSDAAILSRRVDGVIVVLSSGRVNAADVQLLRRRLEEVGATILGSVLNRVAEPFGQPYHAYDRLPMEPVKHKPASNAKVVRPGAVASAGWATRMRMPVPFVAALAGAVALACAVSYLLNKVGF
jgi:capsular exopolysaccharide synthesis family protein